MSTMILVNDLKNIYAENLVSVVIYGENLDKEQLKGNFKQNIIVILNNLDAFDLKKSILAMKKWEKTKNPLPIIMNENEWFSSADIYPVEYTEIKNNYKILYGKNLVTPITVPKDALRLQCEYEIKNILVRIRQIYLGNSDNPQFMIKTLEEISLKLVRILKVVLSLFDIHVNDDYSEVIHKMTAQIKFDGEIFVEILSAKENKRKIAPQKIEIIVQRAINSTDLLYKFVNNLENIF